MQWQTPPIIKIYEALGCIADGRLKLIDDHAARVFSSSRGKFYTVQCDPARRAIMSDDNGSFWVGYLGYPAIAFLMRTGELDFDEKYARALRDIHWKDLNQEHQNDFTKTQTEIDAKLEKEGIDLPEFHDFCARVLTQIDSQKWQHLGTKKRPPSGY